VNEYIPFYWRGVQSSSGSGGVGKSYVEITTTGKFYNNKPSPEIPMYLYPKITQRVSATGGIAATTSPGGWTSRTV
jgi:hypothetical protein